MALREIDAPDYARLFEDRADLIVDHQPAVPKGISALIIAWHHAFLVAPSKHPLLRKKRRPRVDDFLSEPFVAFHPDLPQNALQLDALRTLGRVPERLTFAPSVGSILSFVSAGLGYSLIPWPSRKGPRSPGVVVLPLRGDGTEFPIRVSWRTSSERDAVLDAVLQCIPGKAGDMANRPTRQVRREGHDTSRTPELELQEPAS